MHKSDRNIRSAISEAKAHLLGYSTVTVELLLIVHNMKCRPKVICRLHPEKCVEDRTGEARDSAELLKDINELLHSSFELMYSHFSGRPFGTASVTMERVGDHLRTTSIRFEDRFPASHDDWGRTKYRLKKR